MIAWTERSRSSGIGAHDAVEYALRGPEVEALYARGAAWLVGKPL